MALKYTKNAFHPTASLKPRSTITEYSLSEIISYPATSHIAEKGSNREGHIFFQYNLTSLNAKGLMQLQLQVV